VANALQRSTFTYLLTYLLTYEAPLSTLWRIEKVRCLFGCLENCLGTWAFQGPL